MDLHRYIDGHSVAQRYLNHTLSPSERAQFEAHLVDCQECTDRLLLAEMFHNRNGVDKPAPPVSIAPREPPEALRVRFVRQFTTLQLVLILGGAAALLVLVTALLLTWVLALDGGFRR